MELEAAVGTADKPKIMEILKKQKAELDVFFATQTPNDREIYEKFIEKVKSEMEKLGK